MDDPLPRTPLKTDTETPCLSVCLDLSAAFEVDAARLRSSGTRLLAEPRYRKIMGSRAFHFSAPREWNRLPLSLRSTNSPPSFKKRLIPHYFFLAFKELES